MFTNFRRNPTQIPPVSHSLSAPGPTSQNRRSPSPGDRPTPHSTNSYPRNGGGNLDSNRNELFSGYTRPPVDQRLRNRFVDGDNRGGTQPFGQDPPAGPRSHEEEDDEIEGIKKDTRFLKQESVQSTRNAVRIAREAEETARSTLLKLGDQSEKFADTERLLDLGNAHSARAADKTDELRQLNRSIFRPVIVFNKEKKRAAEEDRLRQRHELEREEREKAMADVRESQNRIGQAANYGRTQLDDQSEELMTSNGRRGVRPEVQNARLEARKRYQFEKSASDDELEDELDDNLEEIHDVSKRLRALAVAAGEELDNQNKRLDRITGKTVALDSKVVRNTDRLKRIK